MKKICMKKEDSPSKLNKLNLINSKWVMWIKDSNILIKKLKLSVWLKFDVTLQIAFCITNQ